MRCGGLLGVNAGSAQEPRMLKLHYAPDGERPRGIWALVGKGIMYDSGGVSLKPSDPMHLLMKMDMGGAASVLATFTALRELGSRARRSRLPDVHRQHAGGLGRTSSGTCSPPAAG